MGSIEAKQELIAELCHQINSPLAAVHNALYIAAEHTEDPAVLRYLELATEELKAISGILRETRRVVGSLSRPSAAPASVVTMPATKRAAA